MLSKVNEYIERFAIGMIVFDEVQQINFTSQNENSFNALMAMANNTMVAIAMIGTDEAIAQIAKIKQVGRRFGIRIPCDAYTTNKDFLDQILLAIERYQWFGKQQKLSTDIKNEIIKESHGVIAYIVLIYICNIPIFNKAIFTHKKRIHVAKIFSFKHFFCAIFNPV